MVQSFIFLGSLLCRPFRRHSQSKGLAAFVDGQKIGDEFSRHGQGAGKPGTDGTFSDISIF
jgi:hypothetical protein